MKYAEKNYKISRSTLSFVLYHYIPPITLYQVHPELKKSKFPSIKTQQPAGSLKTLKLQQMCLSERHVSGVVS